MAVTVKRLRMLLDRFNDDAEILVHTTKERDLTVLSVYSESSCNNPTLPNPPTRFVEIDVGSE